MAKKKLQNLTYNQLSNLLSDLDNELYKRLDEIKNKELRTTLYDIYMNVMYANWGMERFIKTLKNMPKLNKQLNSAPNKKNQPKEIK